MEKNLEKNIENSLNEEEINNNEDIKLKEYKIISTYFEDLEEEKSYEDDNKSKDFYLPTPETFKKMCDYKLVKDFINFDFDKYKSYFNENNNNNTIENKVINLDKIPFIKNYNIVSYLLIFLGGINSINSIYDFFDDSVLMPNDECLIDNNNNYIDYLNYILDYLKNEEQNKNVYFDFSDLELLLKSLYEFGINIIKSDKNILYRNIKDSFFSMKNNKILILIAPSNNFWIKSDKNQIGDRVYDKQLNTKVNIFYNNNFIKKFFSTIGKHSRCKIGLISSMCRHNVQSCYDGLNILFNQKNMEDPIIISQENHDKDDETFFKRNMKKIIDYLNHNNYDYFNITNIIILESEKNKAGYNTKSNSIFVNLFNEEIIESSEMKEKIKIKEDKVIKYIIDLLENCSDDIRDYINKNIYE